MTMKFQALLVALLLSTQVDAGQEPRQATESAPDAVSVEVAPSTVQDSIDRAVR